jgi:hypothetical protein
VFNCRQVLWKQALQESRGSVAVLPPVEGIPVAPHPKSDSCALPITVPGLGVRGGRICPRVRAEVRGPKTLSVYVPQILPPLACGAVKNSIGYSLYDVRSS